MTKQIQIRVAIVIALVLGAIVRPGLAQPEASPKEMLADAELTAVTFIDADRGWAVGDRGVIWHTNDGGRNWKLQNSGVTCRLEAVQFLDGDMGFAVGGWTQPYTHRTQGIVLRTRDGGRTWQNTPGLALPALRQVHFFGPREGWACGDSSDLFPSGVFRTEDGGRSWIPTAQGTTLGWAAGDFRNAKEGAVAALDGTIAVATAEKISLAKAPNFGSRQVQKILLHAGGGGWLVGDGGLVLTTRDSGRTWGLPGGKLPENATSNLDFRAVATHGSHVWIAGAPGTCVLHSADGGQTWQLHRTEQTVPLRGLSFIDEYRGWAVGALGTILHTRDGGLSWRVQRPSGSRVALLGIFSEPGRVPLEIVASQGGSEGYLTAVETIGRRDLSPGFPGREEFTLPQRLREAVIAAGGTAADGAWQFPLPDPGLRMTAESILAGWNVACEAQAQERLIEHLVRRIRQWRPEVICTEDISPRGEDPLGHLTNRLTLEAVERAADSAALPALAGDVGLAPWKVKKVFTVLTGEKQGIVNLSPALWAPRLARSIADQADLGRQLLLREPVTGPRNVGLALLVDQLPQDSGKRDVMSGILMQPGSDGRRLLASTPAGNTEALSRLAQKRHNVAQLLERMDLSGGTRAGWMGQAGDLTKDLSSRHAGEVLWQLSRKHSSSGRASLAAETLRSLLEKHPQHPLADAAALWLVQYYSSGEAAWRERREAKQDVRVARVSGTEESGLPLVTASEFQTAAGQTIPAVEVAGVVSSGPAGAELNPTERAGRAIALAGHLEATRSVLFADPALRFSLATATRRAGQSRAAGRYYDRLASGAAHGEWSACAAAEAWLSNSEQQGPKKICAAVTALEKPKLDGRLDDALWRVAKPVSLPGRGSASEAPSAAAVLAYDEEFLYIGLSCRKVAGADYAAEAGARTPDSDLSKRDRVSIMLDIDRDYGTYWRLEVDHRGWPAEDCLGDKTWNPEWYVAAGGDEQYWTIEAAIPLTELAAKKPEVRDVWAIGIQRVIPGVGLQSFNAPAAIEPRPEGFGLLVFE